MHVVRGDLQFRGCAGALASVGGGFEDDLGKLGGEWVTENRNSRW